jgi:hypothetical protein
MRLQAFVFSYNRGEFLNNCVDSIRRHAPDSQITVVDDHSTDPATRACLAALPDNVRLLQPDTRNQGRHGGLYVNMQAALEQAGSRDIVLFLQEDMQLVRTLTIDDEVYVRDFFRHYPEAAFLNPVFLKGMRSRRDRRITRLAEGFPAYFREYPGKRHHVGLSYADVVMAHAGRLKQANWRFEVGEICNADRAARQFGKMGFMAHPLVMFLPQVPVYRGKQKSWAVGLAERWSGTAPKAFHPMTTAEAEQLKRRELTLLPVAEQYLRCTDPKVKRPYRYSAVNAYPLLRALHKLELGWSKLLNRGAVRGSEAA